MPPLAGASTGASLTGTTSIDLLTGALVSVTVVEGNPHGANVGERGVGHVAVGDLPQKLLHLAGRGVAVEVHEQIGGSHAAAESADDLASEEHLAGAVGGNVAGGEDRQTVFAASSRETSFTIILPPPKLSESTSVTVAVVVIRSGGAFSVNEMPPPKLPIAGASQNPLTGSRRGHCPPFGEKLAKEVAVHVVDDDDRPQVRIRRGLPCALFVLSIVPLMPVVPLPHVTAPALAVARRSQSGLATT